MVRTIAIALFCSVFLLAQSRGQDVFVPRQLKAIPVPPSEKEDPPEAPSPKEPVVVRRAGPTQSMRTPVKEPPANAPVEKAQSAKTEPAKVPVAQEPAANPRSEKVQSVKVKLVKSPVVKERAGDPPSEKVQSVKAEPAKAPAVKELPANPRQEKVQSAKAEPGKVPAVKESPAKPQLEKVQSAKAEPVQVSAVKESPAKPPLEKVQSAKAESVKVAAVKESPAKPLEKVQSAKAEPAKVPAMKESPAKPPLEKVQSAKVEPLKVPTMKESPVKPSLEKVQSVKAESVKVAAVKESPAKPPLEKVQSAKAEPVKSPAMNESSADPPSEKIESAKLASAKMPLAQEPTANIHLLNSPVETASTRLADGFDFPVGKPEAEGYYKARGFRPGGHVGEDWDGVRGGDTDFKDPIYCIGDGVVVFARDVRRGWGNVVIVRHGYREKGGVQYIDSLYGHLNSILVKRGQKVARGQQIGTMGTAHGQYDAHLHLEIRKNIEIGMSRAKFQKTFSNYHDPSQFIASHRHLAGGGANFRVAMNTFTHDSAYHFVDSPKFSARKRSTSESSAVLGRAISSTTR